MTLNLVASLRTLAALAALALAATSPAMAQEAEPVPGGCELGLVLSGGGARGIAHIGVLEVLEEHGVLPDCLAGASMGAVVGAFYASGHTIEEVRGMVSQLTWRNIYAEPQDRRRRNSRCRHDHGSHGDPRLRDERQRRDGGVRQRFIHRKS